MLPAVLVIRFVLRDRVRDYGLRTRPASRRTGRVYAVLFAIAFPVIVIASFGRAFQAKYPFYDLGARRVALAVPLRVVGRSTGCSSSRSSSSSAASWCTASRRASGGSSIFVMVVPYNMLHYGKPMPEALAAIVGGIVLGTLEPEDAVDLVGRVAPHLDRGRRWTVLALWHAGRLL